MISVNGLTVNFGGRFLFDDVSFLINDRDKIGLVGRNGTGKSTLLKILSKIEQPTSGNIIFPKLFRIGYLPQELISDSTLPVYDEVYSAIKDITTLEERVDEINKIISERTDYDSKEYLELLTELSNAGDRLKILGSHSIQSDIEQILNGLGFLRSEFYKPYNEFSGGWQMRVELAKILLQRPDCILLDEPTNHLDIESIRWLEKFLKNYPGSIILVSHDRTFLDKITNRTIEIVNGKIYDMPYNYSNFVIAREQQKEQELAAYKNQQRQIAQTEKFIERFRYKSTLASRVQSRVKALEKINRIEIEEEDGRTIKLKFPEPPRSSRVVVEAAKLSKSYGSLMVLNQIDFALERGEKVAFVGKNGEGKSTLSKIIAGLEEYQGTLKIGTNVMIGYFAQHQALMLNQDHTVFDVIDSAATGEMRSHIRSLLGAFLFSGDDVYKKVRVLSGGEKSRLSLAKLLLTTSNLLILDEPTNHLDMIAKDVLKQAIAEYEGSLIVVSHDREFLDGLTTKTYEFRNNKINEYMGDINEYLSKTEQTELSELEISERAKNSQNKTESVSNSQQLREKKKEIQREINKFNKTIEKLENQISDIEIKISEIEKLFQNPEFFNDLIKSRETQSEYEELRKCLNTIMDEWAENSTKLDELKSILEELN